MAYYDPEAFDPNRGQRYALEQQALGDKPTSYRGVFQTAFGKLDHPEAVPDNFIISGTAELAQGFIDRYYERNNKLPTTDEIKTFVAKSLTPEYAKTYIQQGGIARDVTKSNIVDPYLNDLSDSTTNQISNIPSQVQGQLDNIYNPLQESALAKVRREFAPLRTRAIEEEASLGRLRSGVSAAPGSAIQQVDANEGNALQEVIGNILQQKATGTLDLTKFGETLAAGERRAKESGQQFRETLGFNRQQYGDQQDYNNRALKLSEMLGRLQAEGRKPGTLDYLSTAFGGLGALGSLFTGAGALKTAYK